MDGEPDSSWHAVEPAAKRALSKRAALGMSQTPIATLATSGWTKVARDSGEEERLRPGARSVRGRSRAPRSSDAGSGRRPDLAAGRYCRQPAVLDRAGGRENVDALKPAVFCRPCQWRNSHASKVKDLVTYLGAESAVIPKEPHEPHAALPRRVLADRLELAVDSPSAVHVRVLAYTPSRHHARARTLSNVSEWPPIFRQYPANGKSRVSNSSFSLATVNNAASLRPSVRKAS